MIALKVDQNAFEPRQPTGMDPDPLADLKIRPRLARNLRSDSKLNGLNFPLINRCWRSTATDYLQDSWSYYRRAPLGICESTEDVSWEKRLFDHLLSV